MIFLTAKEEERDVVQGFDVGADDYIQKPFRNRELISRRSWWSRWAVPSVTRCWSMVPMSCWLRHSTSTAIRFVLTRRRIVIAHRRGAISCIG